MVDKEKLYMEFNPATSHFLNVISIERKSIRQPQNWIQRAREAQNIPQSKQKLLIVFISPRSYKTDGERAHCFHN